MAAHLHARESFYLEAGHPYSFGPQLHVGRNHLLANSVGLLPTGSTPNLVNCSTIFGSLVALPTSVDIRSTMAFGVPAAAIRPHHDVVLKTGNPYSAMVGTFGTCAARCSLDTASIRIAPLSI